MTQPVVGLDWDDEQISALRQAAMDALPTMRAIRRHLHTHPELSMQELKTTLYLREQLEQLGFHGQVTGRGVGLVFDWDSPVAEQADSASPPRIGLRADIDALPITTTSSASYASRVEGVMHACGHDAHSAVLVGAARVLKQICGSGVISVPVALRGILQPAEETSEGGPYMVAQGVTEGLKAIFAVHVDPNLQVGQVATRVGAFTAGCDTIEVTFKGRSGHSARPFQAADALAAATNWLQQAYARVPRVHDCREAAVFSIGTFQSGVASNVVADRAVLTGTVRTIHEKTRRLIFESLYALGTAIEAAHGCRVNLEITTHTPALHNDEQITPMALSVARRMFGEKAVGEIALPSMGAEDFAFLGREAPSCMFRLGTAGPREASGQAFSSPLHSPDFDIDEQELAIGAQLLAACVIEASRTTPDTPA